MEQIAQEPLPDRSAARLLVLYRGSGRRAHYRVADLPALLRPGDLLVVNDTRVLPARLWARRATGGRVEVLLLQASGGWPQARQARTWEVLLRPARRVRPGEVLELELPQAADLARGSDCGVAGGLAGQGVKAEPDPRDAKLRVLQLQGEGRAVVVFEGEAVEREGALAVVHRLGQVPLPPYIRRPLADPQRYQTVYARVEGSVAAPTAGLHFTPALLEQLRARGVGITALTLHVGLGTFRPVTTERPEEHRLHAEWFRVSAEAAETINATRRRGGRVVAVGTTVTRTLETRVDAGGCIRPGEGWTDLYILPGWRFRAIDALLTNFHLPRSTLLMLVCAFAGREPVLAAYREAVSSGYRFFSFGDAMLIL